MEKQLLITLREIFTNNKDNKGETLGYSRFKEFLRHITNSLEEYVEHESEQMQVRDVVIQLQNRELENILRSEGINFTLHLAETRLTAENISINLPRQGTVRLNPADVSSTLDQYVVYKREELDLPFSFMIPIKNKVLEEEYYTEGVTREGFGVLLEMLIYLDRENVRDSTIKLDALEHQINRLLDLIVTELLIEIQEENLSMLFRTLSAVSEDE